MPHGHVPGIGLLDDKGNNRNLALNAAEINAGEYIIRGHGVLRYFPTGLKVIARDAAVAGLTTLDFETDEASPTNIASIAVANLTQDNFLDEDSTGVTLGAGFMAALAAGVGIKVTATGTMTGAAIVSVNFEFDVYNLVQPFEAVPA